MSDETRFEEALDAVFEEHASNFGPGLRKLLEQLFLEGVKEGRARTLLESAQLEQRLDELPPKGLLYDRFFEQIESELSLADILSAADKLGVKQPTKLNPVFVSTPKLDDFSDRITASARYGGFNAQHPRREMFGTWVEDPSWTSPNQSSKNSPASSTPASSLRSGTGSIIPGTSNRSSNGLRTASTSSPSESTRTAPRPSRSSETASASGWARKPNSSE
jgi:hypothetical protein